MGFKKERKGGFKVANTFNSRNKSNGYNKSKGYTPVYNRDKDGIILPPKNRGQDDRAERVQHGTDIRKTIRCDEDFL